MMMMMMNVCISSKDLSSIYIDTNNVEL